MPAVRSHPRRAAQQMAVAGRRCACGREKPAFARACYRCSDRGLEFRVLDTLIRGGYEDVPQDEIREIVAYAALMQTLSPVVIDLCCGSGGWADGFLQEGYHVIGYDIDPQPRYPGEFRRADVRKLDGRQFLGATLIVASPPCEEFSRHQMPWTRRRNPPPPDLSIAEACWRIAREAAAPIVLENVRKAQDWLGRATWHCDALYLWGDVPALMPEPPEGAVPKRQSISSAYRLGRARVPIDIAQWIARCYLPGKDVA